MGDTDTDDLEELLKLGEEGEEEVEQEVEEQEEGSWVDDNPQMSDGCDRSEKSGSEEEVVEEVEEEGGGRRVVEVTSPTSTCLLCKEPLQADLHLGSMFRRDGVTAHHFCLMLSSGLHQVGEDEEGIEGFLVADIRRERRRGAKLRCSLCSKYSATVGCCTSSCPRSFHLPCLLRSGGLAQFFGAFSAHCAEHRPRQRVPEACWAAKGKGALTPRQGQCGVCLERVALAPGGEGSLWAPCCKAWYHRACVEKLCLAAGRHHTRCPLCNSKEAFQQEMLRCGVYIPDRDAQWELEEGAFSALYRRHSSCDAPTCTCPLGREHQEQDSDWELVLCELCGAQGVHAACAGLDNVNLRWKCETCLGALKPVERRELDEKLEEENEWVEERDTEEEESEEEVEESEEEEESIIDAAVFEKCFASADDRMWSAVTKCWKVEVERRRVEDMGEQVGNREEVLGMVRRAEAAAEERRRLEEEDEKEKEEEEEGTQMFKCDLCSFMCEGEAGLSRHGRLHDPGRPFSCDECGLRFLRESHVRVHTRIHTGERPHRCHVCGSDFGEGWRLQLHMAKHDQRRKYECPTCNHRFRTRLALKVHKKKHHAGDEEVKVMQEEGQVPNLPIIASVSSMAEGLGDQGDLLTPFRLKLKKPKRTWLEEESGGGGKRRRAGGRSESSESSDSDLYDDRVEEVKVSPCPSRPVVAERRFVCKLCDFKCNYKNNLTRHMEQKHEEPKETRGRKKQDDHKPEEFGFASPVPSPAGQQSSGDEAPLVETKVTKKRGRKKKELPVQEKEFPPTSPLVSSDGEAPVRKAGLILQVRSPLEEIRDRVSAGQPSGSAGAGGAEPGHRVRKKIALVKKKPKSPEKEENGEKKGMDEKKKIKEKKSKVIGGKREYWVVVEGIRNPVRVVEDVRGEQEVQEVVSDDGSGNITPENNYDKTKPCQVDMERMEVSEEDRAYMESVIKETEGGWSGLGNGKKHSNSESENFKEQETEGCETDGNMHSEADTEVIESNKTDKKTDESEVVEEEDEEVLDLHLSSATEEDESEQEKPKKKIMTGLGFFLIAEENEDNTKKTGCAAEVEVEVERMNVSKDDLNNMKAVMETSETGAFNNPQSQMVEVNTETVEALELSGDSLKLGILELAPSPEEGSSMQSPSRRSSTMDSSMRSPTLESPTLESPLLPWSRSELPRLGDLEDLLGSASEEGSVGGGEEGREGEDLLRPEDLLPRRASREEEERRPLDPDLHNLFLELEGLEAQPSP